MAIKLTMSDEMAGSEASHVILPDQCENSDQIMVFQGQRILMKDGSYFWSVSQLSGVLNKSHPPVLVEQDADCRYLAVQCSEDLHIPPKSEFISLRQLLMSSRDVSFRIPGLGNQLLNWYHSHQFCGACGGPTEPHLKDRALVCSACGQGWYPRINPCVIVLISDGPKLLLARHARYRMNLYTCLAGFIEVGETPEQTVAREVKEEAGIEIANIRYIKSQSWPFPSQLMLGYFADYAGGDLQPEPEEIDDLKWFLPEELPVIPNAKISVAGELIDLHCRQWRADR